MRVIIEMRVEDETSGVGRAEPMVVAEWRWRDQGMADPGMTLADGRDLLGQRPRGPCLPTGGRLDCRTCGMC